MGITALPTYFWKLLYDENWRKIFSLFRGSVKLSQLKFFIQSLNTIYLSHVNTGYDSAQFCTIWSTSATEIILVCWKKTILLETVEQKNISFLYKNGLPKVWIRGLDHRSKVCQIIWTDGFNISISLFPKIIHQRPICDVIRLQYVRKAQCDRKFWDRTTYPFCKKGLS